MVSLGDVTRRLVEKLLYPKMSKKIMELSGGEVTRKCLSNTCKISERRGKQLLTKLKLECKFRFE